MKFFASCGKGLEYLLADELQGYATPEANRLSSYLQAYSAQQKAEGATAAVSTHVTNTKPNTIAISRWASDQVRRGAALI